MLCNSIFIRQSHEVKNRKHISISTPKQTWNVLKFDTMIINNRQWNLSRLLKAFFVPLSIMSQSFWIGVYHCYTYILTLWKAIISRRLRMSSIFWYYVGGWGWGWGREWWNGWINFYIHCLPRMCECKLFLKKSYFRGLWHKHKKVIFNNFDGFSSIISDNVLDRIFKIK